MIKGSHLIAGQWKNGSAIFSNHPTQGEARDFSAATPSLVDEACQAAEEAFWSFGYASRAERAAFLDAIAEEIDARGDAITQIGSQETGLPEARLIGERGRTVGQLRLFAEVLRDGEYLDRRHDEALPERAPVPRPDLKLVQRPIGPVAVFGASNFPLAFSTAGGDTAAALAAGCPVVVRGHWAHPGTADLVAQAVEAAISRCGTHPGVFSLVQGGDNAVGAALVQHPLIKAVGFTGSLAGGRALFDLCAQRPEPIPFFGELGSINPMFLLPSAVKARAAELGAGWAASLTMGAGQFCTNPGLVVVTEGQGADTFITAAASALQDTAPQTMLTDGIAQAYRTGCSRFSEEDGVIAVQTSKDSGRIALPQLYRTTSDVFLEREELAEEVFGPLGLVVTVKDSDEMLAIASKLSGQLTATLHLDDDDHEFGRALMPVLERKAGRILTNGFPTGVEVSATMVHGGPYPASTNFGATSVGTMAIRRFLRPVCYQNMPLDLLPDDLQ